MTLKGIKWFILEKRKYKCGACHKVLTFGASMKKHRKVHTQKTVELLNFKSVGLVKACLSKQNI